MGLSAQAIAYSGNRDHPHDPSDLLRCAKYIESRGMTTAELQVKMAGRSPAWDRLLPEWDTLVTLLRHEMETRTDGLATLTYAAMKRVIDGGVECADCAGSGRSEDCLKCKGTGRRGGGRCRADRCWRGADLCPTCHGRGFTNPQKAA